MQDCILELGKEYYKEDEGKDFFISVIHYLFEALTLSNKEKDIILNTLDKIVYKGGELAMTFANKLRREGIREGKREAAVTMLKKEFHIENIADITGLDIDEITELNEKI